jgi:hypothetical protein
MFINYHQQTESESSHVRLIIIIFIITITNCRKIKVRSLGAL